MKQLGFRVVISSPYSFGAACIEYAFGFLKSVDLNEANIASGKR